MTVTFHECDFPVRDHDGPGPCSCGITYAQHQAGHQFAAAAEAIAAAWPLPDVPYLTGIDGRWHAIHRAEAGQYTRWYGRDPVIPAVCGDLVHLARAWPEYTRADRPRSMPACPACAWTVAAARGEIDSELERLTPGNSDMEALARLIPDPLIAVTAAAMLVEACRLSGYTDEELEDAPETITLLAEITRHKPVILVPEDCADGSCEHYPDGSTCSRPEAAAACEACSLQAGPWAGEWAGDFRDECTISAPCEVLTRLAAHARDEFDQAKRTQETLAQWEGEEAGQPENAAAGD